MNRLLQAFLAFLFVLPVYAGVGDELLEPDKAFSLSTRIVDANTLEARWKIAPGYYMYRDKFKFESLDEKIVLQQPIIPRGKKKKDPFFGVVETYTKSVKVQLPIERKTSGAHNVKLRITAQGCNEPVGVCYPPMIKQVSFNLPPVKSQPLTAENAILSETKSDARGARAPKAAPEGRGPGTAPAKIQSLKDLAKTIDGGSGVQEVVDPEKAFTLLVEPFGKDTLRARFEIADCCYLYRDKTNFELTRLDGGPPPEGVRLGNYKLPRGKIKVDEFVGKTEVYHKGFDIRLPIEGLGNETKLALKATYQGCSEKGVTICYPPATKTFSVTPGGGGVLAVASLATGLSAGVADTDTVPATQPSIDETKFILVVLGAFGIGLLLTFTPCVLPMIPILSSAIVGSGDKHITKLKGGLLSLSYVLGTAVTYTIVGVIAGATGEQLQAYFQNIWAIGTFSILFALLALSMFGFYELQMPHFIQSHLHNRTRRFKGGSFIGVFFLGLFSALIIGACVSPLFISALGVAIANRDAVLGGAIMFSMALGMGMILIAIGVGAGFLLPKAGPWMDRIKQVFGVLLLAVAIYLLGFLPEVPVLFLWAALFIITGVYLGATQSLPKGASGWRYLWKGIGTFLLVWGVLALLGGLAGNRDIFNPLPMSLSGGGVAESARTSAEQPVFEQVRTLRELESRLAAAKAAGKPAFLDYYASWCTDCVRLEKTTFADPQVREELRRRFVSLQADVTDPNDPEFKAIKRRFGVYGPPAMLFFSSNGEERRDLRAYGYRSKEEFLALLRQIK